ncbi:Phosphatase and actin regulator 4-B [Toxocara canis]|uniref:Phosphatase and actin regulator 4-B n=1 Tax=Toxocara canis TaxID=6265 RepID=A0A0B2VB46_TOXCA|nr:Phosphatase and actin regulator 4-B [Toxocara canis]
MVEASVNSKLVDSLVSRSGEFKGCNSKGEAVGADAKVNCVVESEVEPLKSGSATGSAVGEPHTPGESLKKEIAAAIENSSPKSLGGGGKRSRAFGGSLKTTRFWMRILRPWKWGRKNRKISLRRTNSDRSPESDAVVTTMPTSLSSIEPIHMAAVADDQSKASSWNGCLDLPAIESEPLKCEEDIDRSGPETNESSGGGDTLRLTAEELSVPSVQRVVIVDCTHKPTNCIPEPDLSFAEDIPDDETASTISRADNIDDECRECNHDEDDERADWEGRRREETVTFEMDFRLMGRPVVEEIAAKEPDLSAKPNRPVLKKPGAPSRLKVTKRSSLHKVQPADGFIDPNNLNVKSTRLASGDLPSRLTDDSDSDTDIQYRDEGPVTWTRRGIGHSTNPAIASRLMPHRAFDTDDDDDIPLSGLAAKVNRRDTLARKLDAPDPVDDIPNQTSDDRRRLMHRVSIKLERKLSERPSAEELEQRNILKSKDGSISSKKAMEETRKMLLRKLSFRPTVQQLKEKQIIKFNDYVEVTEAEVYDRKADKPWTRLTPTDKALIRKELNDFKATEMDVHEESRIFTRFHRP